MSIRPSAARNPILCLLVFLAALAPPILGAEGRLLKYNHTRGDKALYDFDLKGRIQGKGPDGKPVEVSVGITMACLATFLGDTPNGDWGIQGDITEGSMTAKVVKGEGTDGTFQFSGGRSQYTVAPSGEITLVKPISGTPPVLQLGVAAMALGPEDAFLLSGVGIFPNRPLKKGDTWKGVTSIRRSNGGRVQKIAYESVFLGDAMLGEVPCQKIKTTAKQKIHDNVTDPNGGGTAEIAVDTTKQITWLFDPKRSLIVSSEGTQNVKALGKLTGPAGQQTSIAVTSTGTIRTRLREFNGKPVVTH
jgi:hypothetical protein